MPAAPKTNAMSSKTRKNVEQKFRASGFNNFGDAGQNTEDQNRIEMKKLFYNPANRK